jgi:hypothetical protein
MTLKEILETTPNLNSYDYIGTDKNTVHSYIDKFYEHAFQKYQKKENMSLLEIGVHAGGSLYLWGKYFSNGHIVGIDIVDRVKKTWKELSNVQYMIKDGYDKNFVDLLPSYDIIIDDGPHTIDTQQIFINYYLPKINDGGLLIIEDIQSIENAQILYDSVPTEFWEKTSIIDLRSIKNRYDDILLVIEK